MRELRQSHRLSGLILLSVISYLQNIPSSATLPITNKMRYGNPKEISAATIPLEGVLDLTSTTSTFNSPIPSASQNRYAIIPRERPKSNWDNIDMSALDEEDKYLLKKFYSKTKDQIVPLENPSSLNSLWGGQDLQRWSALIDAGSKSTSAGVQDDERKALFRNNPISDWSPAHKLKYFSEKPRYVAKNPPSTMENFRNPQADYSPSLRLLTSYSPLKVAVGSSIPATPLDSQSNILLGATVDSGDKSSKPGPSAISTLKAIKLHDELMKKPPNDGKVRVRMYFHRAIHDDASLYGTGPWKYWGHGWGLEFGYDPLSEKKNKDLYQKGYTIERAFGRDFCIDKNNCRSPDPDFFKDPHDVGKYSKQHAAKMKQSRNGIMRKVNEYRRS